MAGDDLTSDEICVMAEAIGLTHLSEDHLQQLRQVTNAKRRQQLAPLIADLTPADEPANTFSLAD